MQPDRIAELLAPFLVAPAAAQSVCHSQERSAEACPELSRREPAVLSPTQLQSILTYINLLLRWNARINLTAIRDPEEIVTRHFGESFFAARVLFPDGPAVLQGRVARQETEDVLAPRGIADAPRLTPNARPSLADIGSGAGFPGLPIKLWASAISLTLIESNHKKATFLHEVARALTLTDINIMTARAETLTGVSFHTVTLRAVERFKNILPVAAGLVAPQGRLALLVGADQLNAAQVNEARTTLPGFSWSQPVPVPLSRSRVLIIAHRAH